MSQLISLGFSCQTRFSIDLVSADFRRLPFDFNITTRGGLLEALRSDGAGLRNPDPESFELYRMPVEGREGLVRDGIYFWHDFPMNGLALKPGWQAALPEIARKYDRAWQRFAAHLRAGNVTLFLSNTQANLTEFASSNAEFDARFALNLQFWHELRAALADMGCTDFSTVFLNRSLEDSLEVNTSLRSERARSVFGGELSLPTHQKTAFELFATPQQGVGVEVIAGEYSNGLSIEPVRADTAVIRRRGRLWGEITAGFDGYRAAFVGQRDCVFSAIFDDGRLQFSNRTAWQKVSAARRRARSLP